jgi:hypothetical protein
MAISLEISLTDTIFLMFYKLVGSLARKAERQTADNSLKTLRQAQGNLRTLAAACRAVIDARDGKADAFAAVESRVGWDKFVRCVVEAESMARPETTDNRAQLIKKYPPSGYCPIPWSFEPGGGQSMACSVRLALIRDMYRAGKRATRQAIDRVHCWAWRLREGRRSAAAPTKSAQFGVEDRLRAGDVWVEGSRLYQD